MKYSKRNAYDTLANIGIFILKVGSGNWYVLFMLDNHNNKFLVQQALV